MVDYWLWSIKGPFESQVWIIADGLLIGDGWLLIFHCSRPCIAFLKEESVVLQWDTGDTRNYHRLNPSYIK